MKYRNMTSIHRYGAIFEMHGILPMEQINSVYAIRTKGQARNATGRELLVHWCYCGM